MTFRTYFMTNGKTLPQNIIVYRDGVGAGDIARLKETEIAALRVSFTATRNRLLGVWLRSWPSQRTNSR